MLIYWCIYMYINTIDNVIDDDHGGHDNLNDDS